MAATETYSNSETNANSICSSNVVEISSNQEILTLALRTLRISKSNLYAVPTENVFVEEKCRKIICLNEVANHDSICDCWIVLYDRVYDVTHFLDKVN